MRGLLDAINNAGAVDDDGVTPVPFGERFKVNTPHARIRKIISDAAVLNGTSYAEVVAPKRGPVNVCKARDLAISIVATNFPDMSLPAIGRHFNRDHSTILHSIQKTKTIRARSKAAKAGANTNQEENTHENP